MSQNDFVANLRKKTDPLWSAILNHPFVRGIGDGSLSRDRFEHYLKQDYAYLIGFSRILAIAAAKAETLSDMSRFANLLNLTLNMEMDLHRQTCADFEISPKELERTEPGQIASAYTNLLLRTSYEGSFSDMLAVFLPCALGYVEIAEHLLKAGLPDEKHYRNWIETYSSREMLEIRDWLVERMNSYAGDS
jgi:thiaminase/transcriptional activator TenA